MTPNRRLDQLEPEVAEVLQKTDRLIEGQGQLVDLATKTKADVDQVKTDVGQVKTDVGQVRATGEITAIGLAKLTITVNDLRAETIQRFDDLRAETIQRFGDLRGEMNQGFDDLRGETTQGFDDLRGETTQRFDDLRAEMNQRFNRSEQVQQEILTFLRERLS